MFDKKFTKTKLQPFGHRMSKWLKESQDRDFLFMPIVVCLSSSENHRKKPRQERQVELNQAVRGALGRCKTDRDHLCVVAIIEAKGDIDGAVDWLYGDVEKRRSCRLGSELDARRAIRKTAQAVAA